MQKENSNEKSSKEWDDKEKSYKKNGKRKVYLKEMNGIEKQCYGDRQWCREQDAKEKLIKKSMTR